MDDASFVGSFCETSGWSTFGIDVKELPFVSYTPCFEDAGLMGVVRLCLIFASCRRLVLLSRDRQKLRLRFFAPQLVKLLLVAVLALCPVLQLGGRLAQGQQLVEGALPPIAPFEIFGFVLEFVAWVLVAAVLAWELAGGCSRVGIGYLRFCFAFAFLTNSIKLRFIYQVVHGHHFFYLLFFVSYGCMAILALSSVAAPALVAPDGAAAPLLDEEQRQQGEAQVNRRPSAESAGRPNSEASAGLFARFTFQWVTPMMTTGYARPLMASDLFQLARYDFSKTLAGRLQDSWAEQVHSRREKASLMRALPQAWLAPFVKSGLWKVANDAQQFTGPVLMGLLLKALAEIAKDPQDSSSVLRAYACGCGMYLMQNAGAFGEAQYFQGTMRCGMQVRSALMSTIFAKSMRLSSISRSKFGTGRLNNMMSADCEAMQQLVNQLHMLWSAPLRIVLAMIFLSVQVGYATITGTILICLAVPVQKFIMTRMGMRMRASTKATDERVRLTNEAFGAIQVVKLYAWENSFMKATDTARGEELSKIRSFANLRAVSTFFVTAIPALVSTATFTTFACLYGVEQLTPAIAFTTLSLLNVLAGPLQNFPNVINQISQATIALERLNELLLAEEVSPWPEPVGIRKGEVEFQSCTFRWNPLAADSAELSRVSLKIQPGALAVVVGSTGSGKSSLLSAVLGDMPLIQGRLRVSKAAPFAYVPQNAFIFHGTVRENIAFGMDFDQERYDRVLEAACLTRDLSLFPAGDKTEIGERGVNLSGGQKQRVSMARALYHCEQAHIFLMDDPLSALDAAVAREVHEKALVGMLQGKTRILATNRVEFVSSCDQGIFMSHGTVAAHGRYQELLKDCAEFRQLMKEGGAVAQEEEAAKDKVAPPKAKAEAKPPEEKSTNVDDGKLIQQEHRATGVVSKRVVGIYCLAIGGFAVVALIAATFIVVELCRSGASVWLSVWSTHSTEMTIFEAIGVYVLINATNLSVNFMSQLVLARQGVEGGRALQKSMYASLIRAPMVFFDTTPLGRVINRFTKDVSDVDKNTITMLSMFVRQVIQMTSAVLIIGSTAYYTLFAFAPIFAAFYTMQQYYNVSAREIKRLDALTRSPIYQEFGQCLDGIASIRAYGKQDSILDRCGLWIDRHIQTNVAAMSANRWLALRLEALGSVLVLLVAWFSVAARDVLNPGFAGLALSQVLQLTGMVGAITRLWSAAEQSMNSVERINEYAQGVDPEAPSVIEATRPPGVWPGEGRIEYRDVWASYRAGLPAVLRGLTFVVQPGEKVGIVGRTGAGKSSTLLTLFRIVEVSKGCIQIDGVDTSALGLFDLRSRIGIIPQDPFIFKGTVRSNLDPFGEHQDHQLWTALEQAHLAPVLKGNGAGLNVPIEEAGSNLSVGQRQLVCLARAVLRKARILVLDEATASVDVQTDALIQQTIRDVFATCTMLTIAHRLQTIIDSDKILVMDAGTVLEFDSPKVLLSTRESAFYSMVQETGKANAESLINAACGTAPKMERVLSAESSPDCMRSICASEGTPAVWRERSMSSLADRSDGVLAGLAAGAAQGTLVEELIGSICGSLGKAEAAAEDLQANQDAVPAEALDELRRLHHRLGDVIGRMEQKLVADVQLQS